MSEPMNILLTGGAGFSGSHVSCFLVTKYPNYKFIILDKLTYSGHLRNLEEIADKDNMTFVKGDICDEELVDNIFKKHHINIVLHFAAETHVDRSFNNIVEFMTTNVIGTGILCKVANKYWMDSKYDNMYNNISKKLFIHVSTDEVYGESMLTDMWPKDAKMESDPLLPTNPYAASKAAAEEVALSFYRSYKLPLIVTRCNNIYGPRQFPEKMIPKFIQLLKDERPLCIYGKGLNRRAWVYTRDLCDAYDTFMHSNKVIIGESYNVSQNLKDCNEFEFNNIQTSKLLIDIVVIGIEKASQMDEKEKEEQYYYKYLKFVKDRKCHDMRYLINGDKMATLGWTAKYTFKQGLIKTVEWYNQHADEFWNEKDHFDMEHILVPHVREDIFDIEKGKKKINNNNNNDNNEDSKSGAGEDEEVNGAVTTDGNNENNNSNSNVNQRNNNNNNRNGFCFNRAIAILDEIDTKLSSKNQVNGSSKR